MEKKVVLIVDDELEMRKLLSMCLSPDQYSIKEAATGDEALHILMETSIDIVLLDIMMPEKDGFDVLKEIREYIDGDVPVIMLTALGESEKVVEGLQSGADDYIVKPFEPRELLARIESILRRTGRGKQTKGTTYQIHDLVFEMEKARVSFNDTVIPLTKKELNVLHRLAMNPGRVFSREHLLELEWEGFYEGDQRTVDAHIKNIREKLKKCQYTKPIVETVWGIGYQMVEEIDR
ncbi:response regulator transcription factor [Bacillus alkalicellulosilyticus]|uniref:response regulator transcription factor n=1 Tax=Alkalihalobacterium alkalicellulosilyticum TaxID=1912214 RepID=UPI000997271B|nr:response regulator transcription factor [Bacillus alkalicellulosilyticus]